MFLPPCTVATRWTCGPPRCGATSSAVRRDALRESHPGGDPPRPHAFDFGRSQWNTGTYRFKEQWGARAVRSTTSTSSGRGGGPKLRRAAGAHGHRRPPLEAAAAPRRPRARRAIRRRFPESCADRRPPHATPLRARDRAARAPRTYCQKRLHLWARRCIAPGSGCGSTAAWACGSARNVFASGSTRISTAVVPS